MSTPSRINLYDGSTWITSGINSGSSPDALPRSQLSFAVNATMRGDKPHQRPGFKKRALTFAAYQEGSAYARTAAQVQTAFETGLFQRAGTYIWRGSGQTDRSFLLASVSGRIYLIDCSTWNISDITLPGDPNSSTLLRAWFEQAEMFSLIQNGQDRCLIFDGAGLRRADPAAKEVPVGTITRYALGRLTVVLPDGRSFMAGNLVGTTASGTISYGFRDSILKFDENLYLDGGGVFSAPYRITAIAEVATLDTTLSQGPIQVFTSNGAYSVNYPFDRAEWAAVTYPLVTGSLLSHGALSQESTVNVNNDLWFRSSDGIRSLRVARRNFDGWGDTPLSHEVERIITFDTPSLLSYSSGVLFDNRLIQTASPRYIANRGVVHHGLIPLDFNEASSIARDGIPAYEGLWTGLRVLQILSFEVEGVLRCFLFTLDSSDKIVLYELTLSDTADNYGTEQVSRIPWLIETCRYNWGENSVTQRRFKKLIGGDISTSHMSGEVDFTVRFRADSYPVWTDWHNWSECAEQACAQLFCDDPNQSQAREPMRLPDPQELCEAYTGTNAGKGTPKLTKFGFAFQQRIEVTGAAQIESTRLIAVDQPEPIYETCRSDEPCITLQACNAGIFGYEIT